MSVFNHIIKLGERRYMIEPGRLYLHPAVYHHCQKEVILKKYMVALFLTGVRSAPDRPARTDGLGSRSRVLLRRRGRDRVVLHDII